MADKKNITKTAGKSVKKTADKKVNSPKKQSSENNQNQKNNAKSTTKKTNEIAKKTELAKNENVKNNPDKIASQAIENSKAETTANSAKKSNFKTKKSTLTKSKTQSLEKSTSASNIQELNNDKENLKSNPQKTRTKNKNISNSKSQNKKLSPDSKEAVSKLSDNKNTITVAPHSNDKSKENAKSIAPVAKVNQKNQNQTKFNRNKKNNNKNFPEKRKTLTFSFQLLFHKNANQVSLNKVKQRYDELNENQKAINNTSDFIPNIISRHNFVDLTNFSITIGKAILPNPASSIITSFPLVSMKRFKFQKFELSENKVQPVETVNDLILENELYKVNYFSRNSKTNIKTPDKTLKIETPKPKEKKQNKFEKEALALKNEVYVLPDINYIKYTFPELEEEKEKKAKAKSANADIKFTKIQPDKKIIFSENMNPFLKEMYDEISFTLDEDFSISLGAKILLAVSGGVDSIAMLDIFAQIAQEKKLNLYVAHFNHKLRGAASDKDEAMVKKICDEYGVKCYLGSENILKFASENSISIEQAARINRYKMFERLAGNLKLDYVATAHTADDSVETFFLNLFRGSGLTGLSGIPQKRLFFKTTYLIRPLLKISKEKLINYARIRALSWNEDKTNLLSNYTRNKIRLDLLPKIKNEYSPAIFNLIERTSRLIKGADEFISNYVSSAVNSIIYERRKDRFSIPIAQLQTYTDYIQSEIIQEAFATVFSSLPLHTKTIDRIFETIDAPVGSICNINKNYYVLKDRNKLIFATRNGNSSINQVINKISETTLAIGTIKISETTRNKVEYTRDPNIEYVDADLLPANLLLRNWQAGDVFKPIGMEGTMKISDFLTNQKVSQIDKQSVLVLSTKSEIIWVVGRRLSNDFKVTQSTSKILKLEFIPIAK